MTHRIRALCIECHYAEWHDLFIVMLNIIILSVVLLSFVAPSTEVEHSLMEY